MAAPGRTAGENESEKQSTVPNSNESLQGKEKKADEADDYGYYFYPDRSDTGKIERGFFHRTFRRDDVQSFKCWQNVQTCVKTHPMVRLMIKALHSRGCPVDLKRHISCEPCLHKVAGGFDPKTMQVVVCQNTIQDESVTCSVLAHELLHAFDFCRAKADFEDVRHLACTEIRAANMNHCSLGAAFEQGHVMSNMSIKKVHEWCVRNKALQSVMLVRNLTTPEAMRVIDEVFDRCYNDTEPYGRRCFKDLGRAKRAYDESRNYYDYS